MRTILLLLANMGANTAAHISLKRSATGTGEKRFLLWQVAGNLAAFIGVLAFTGLLQGMSLHVAYPLTEGTSALGVQLVGSLLLFREKIPLKAWAGTGLILMGIVLFSL
jgi:multidrug transporter EmrE-like cation transporter